MLTALFLDFFAFCTEPSSEIVHPYLSFLLSFVSNSLLGMIYGGLDTHAART